MVNEKRQDHNGPRGRRHSASRGNEQQFARVTDLEEWKGAAKARRLVRGASPGRGERSLIAARQHKQAVLLRFILSDHVTDEQLDALLKAIASAD